MSGKKVFFLLFFIAATIIVCGTPIIPYPVSLQETTEKYSYSGKNTIYYSPQITKEAKLLSKIFSSRLGAVAVTKKGTGSKGVVLKIDSSLRSELGGEGYKLEVTDKAILLTAPESAGIFYGIQTLKQLINGADRSRKTISGVKILDKPRFAWRAFMLDEGRYFKGEQTVKDILDEMALLKLNIFHWHLTDDGGWRIEIKKYPLLTEIGSKRDSSQVGVWPSGWASKKYDGKPHEGYYTQEQIKEIVQYAKDRHITVVPEIEMPGHSSAAIAAYPWLGVKDSAIKVPVTFGVRYDVFNVANERVRDFLKDVLLEVMELFPSQVIHIGGDEVRHNQWKESQMVQDFMKKNQIASPAELQVWFTNVISRYIESKGRRMMGWNEIMGSKLHDYVSSEDVLIRKPLAKNAIIHFWKGDLNLIEDAAANGHDIVNSFHEYTYLDYDLNAIPLSKSYSFKPVPENLPEKYHKQIIGLGTQMWGEWIPTVESMNKLLYPRLAAYAEVGWTMEGNKDFDRFLQAVQGFY